jgi:SAM-dependent methyltransferase
VEGLSRGSQRSREEVSPDRCARPRRRQIRSELGERVDKFDEREVIDYRDDVQSLHFGNDTFDAVACDAVLEHVPRPWLAIAELNRVLKPGGAIWVSVPMTYPYHEGPKDYWRVTPDALRIWMADFVEVRCGIHYWSRSSLVCATHFYGRRRQP